MTTRKPPPKKPPSKKSRGSGSSGRTGDKLTEEQKRWLVYRFACFGRISEVVAAFEEEFGKPIAKNVAANYNMALIRDEAHAIDRGVAKWLPLHQEARQAYAARIAHIPIADATYRLEKIDEMFAMAWEKRNFRSAMQLLEQAAKETGGAFTSKRQVEGGINHHHTHEEVPIEAQRSVIAERIGEAMTALMQAGKQTPSPDTKH